jgi:ABC-type spermidine/putrescine transport system permease subunit II
MILLMKLILITAIWCLGIKIATAKGMILEGLGEWAEDKVEQGHKIFEPLLVCPWCMPSIHSAIGYLFAFSIGVVADFKFELVIMYPLVVMGASVVTGLTWTIYETISQVYQYFKNLNDGN